MKYLLYSFVILFTIACNNQEPEDLIEKEQVCENDAFQFSIDVNGITMNSDSCWLVFFDDPAATGILTDYPAIIKWQYPGYPEWDGANSFTFVYNTDAIESDKTYQAREIIGLVQFDGSSGEMIQGLGSESISVEIVEYNRESGYICGSFEGKATFTDFSIVDVVGSFKGVLDPQ